MTKNERDQRNIELMRELNELRNQFSLCDESLENIRKGKRIKEIREELIKVGYIKSMEPRKNYRPAKVVNR